MQVYDPIAREELRNRFKGREQVTPTYIPKEPVSPEREYIRLMNQIMKIIKDSVLEELPTLEMRYAQEMRTDGIDDLDRKLKRLFAKIGEKIDKLIRAKDMRKILQSISRHGRNISVKEWKRLVHKTLGIDISEDYYKGHLMDDLMEKWVNDNVDLIKTIPQNALDEMKKIILKGYKEGANTKAISKEIQEAYGISKRHAQFIARDQMAKLNADMTRKEHEDAGVTRFKWRTVGDGRVRDSHRRLNNQVFEYAKPPINERGERILPGTDYQCRCVAIPVLDLTSLRLPMEEK